MSYFITPKLKSGTDEISPTEILKIKVYFQFLPKSNSVYIQCLRSNIGN